MHDLEIKSESGLGRVCGLHYLVLIRVCDLSFEGFVKGRAVLWVLGRFMLFCSILDRSIQCPEIDTGMDV